MGLIGFEFTELNYVSCICFNQPVVLKNLCLMLLFDPNPKSEQIFISSLYFILLLPNWKKFSQNKRINFMLHPGTQKATAIKIIQNVTPAKISLLNRCCLFSSGSKRIPWKTRETRAPRPTGQLLFISRPLSSLYLLQWSRDLLRLIWRIETLIEAPYCPVQLHLILRLLIIDFMKRHRVSSYA